MVEDVFIRDLETRGVEVIRNTPFTTYHCPNAGGSIKMFCQNESTEQEKLLQTQYLVGCDGAHSKVRQCIPDAKAEGSSSEAIWGVLDGVIDTNFPDLWSKVVIYSEEAGNVLCIPRERNMTRLYIELRSEASGASISKAQATQKFVMKRAREIMKPYTLGWESVGKKHV